MSNSLDKMRGVARRRRSCGSGRCGRLGDAVLGGGAPDAAEAGDGQQLATARSLALVAAWGTVVTRGLAGPRGEIRRGGQQPARRTASVW
jgi:hypothetical protein